MVRQVTVTVPHEKAPSVLSFLENDIDVHGLNQFKGHTTDLLIFRATQKKVQRLLKDLRDRGVGVRFGIVDVIDLLTTKPDVVNPKTSPKKQYKTTDRMSVEEIFEFVDSQGHLTFDYLTMTFAAVGIAAAGLLSDSSVTVVASMLVSPLIGPILCVALGIALSDWPLIKRGLRNELAGALLALVMGMLIGLASAPFFGPCGLDKSWTDDVMRSDEMESRGSPTNLLSGFFGAAGSGIGAAVACTGGGINALVGVAISASLLPPVVNSGICLMFGVFYSHCDGANGHHEARHFLNLALYSSILFLLNFVTIILFALLVFKIKKVRPYKKGPLRDTNGEIIHEYDVETGRLNTTSSPLTTAQKSLGGGGGEEEEKYCDEEGGEGGEGGGGALMRGRSSSSGGGGGGGGMRQRDLGVAALDDELRTSRRF